MFQTERQQEIISVLRLNGFQSVERLAEHIHISPSSIRRDLRKLEALGLVKRSYGGAALVGGENHVLPTSLRETINHAEKSIIAAKAADLIHDGDSVLLDWSTTVQHMIPYLSKAADITVFTNSVKTCRLLCDCGINTYCLGGQFLIDSSYVVGSLTEQMLNSLCVNVIFFSALAVSPDGDVFEPLEAERSLRLKMLERSRVKVFMADHGKFEAGASTFRICNLKDVDYVVTDTETDEAFRRKFPNTVFL